MEKKKKVFIVTYGGGHVNIIKSIYDALINKSNLEINILALTMAPLVLKENNIPCITISEIAKMLHNYEKIMRIGSRLAKIYHNEESGIKYEDSVAYLGIGYYDLICKYGEKKAEEIFEKEGRKAFLPIECMSEIVDFIKPDIIIVTTSPRMEKAAGIVANQKDIPVIRICDLPIVSYPDYDCIMCVMNDWTKEYAVNISGISSDRIVVTGQPVFEKNIFIDDTIKQEYLKKVKNKYKNIVLYLGQPKVVDMDITVLSLYEFAKKNHDILVIVRPHPNDQIEDEQEKIDNFVITKEGVLKYLISISDVVVTHYSTAGLEAALMKKPLVTVLINASKRIQFSKYGIAIEINAISELESCIMRCINNDEICEELLKKQKAFQNRSNATNNIVKVIERRLYEKEILES